MYETLLLFILKGKSTELVMGKDKRKILGLPLPQPAPPPVLGLVDCLASSQLPPSSSLYLTLELWIQEQETSQIFADGVGKREAAPSQPLLQLCHYHKESSLPILVKKQTKGGNLPNLLLTLSGRWDQTEGCIWFMDMEVSHPRSRPPHPFAEMLQRTKFPSVSE